jgi:hypothetical protein
MKKPSTQSNAHSPSPVQKKDPSSPSSGGAHASHPASAIGEHWPTRVPGAHQGVVQSMQLFPLR